jgi:hypothetical protein
MAAENWWDVPFVADARAEELARLREQRRHLGLLRDGVDDAGRRLAATPVDAGWRSPAQRAYEGRLVELAVDLQRAGRSLAEAAAAVDEAIVRAKSAP